MVASPALWIGSMEVRYYMDTGSQLHVRSYGMQDQLKQSQSEFVHVHACRTLSPIFLPLGVRELIAS